MPTDTHHAASLRNALVTSRSCAGARHRLKNPLQTGTVECRQFSRGGLLVDRSCSFTVLPTTSVSTTEMVRVATPQSRRWCGTIHFPTDHTQWADLQPLLLMSPHIGTSRPAAGAGPFTSRRIIRSGPTPRTASTLIRYALLHLPA